jgi:UTP--glucose-1-phosphate uridylyltransferase
MSVAKVRKAVFPAAGLGTRFLPATKAQPKEMLPLVDKPIIQYGVEEALHSGIQNIIIVTGRGKSAIEDHFDVSFELEQLLESRNKKDLLAIVRQVSDMIDVSYIRQKEALGLGHAVLRAKELVGEDPFAVVLADDRRKRFPPMGASTPSPSRITAARTKYSVSATLWKSRRPARRRPIWRSSAVTF